MSIQELKDLLREDWSNNACLGYAKIACEQLSYTDEQTQELLKSIENAFGNYSVEQAKKRIEH